MISSTRAAHRIARALWHRYALGPFFDLDDWLSEASLIALEAGRKFNPARGTPLGAWVAMRVRWDLIEMVRRTAREPSSGSLDLGAVLALGEQEWYVSTARRQVDHLREQHEHATVTPHDNACRAEVRRAVRAAIRQLPPNERYVVWGHYIDGEPCDELATQQGVKRTTTWRRKRNGVKRLRELCAGLEAA